MTARARHRWRLLVFAATGLWGLAGCDHKHEDEGHDHASEHPEGHDHHAEDHGHARPMLRVTLWSDRFELFVEHPPAVAGRELTMLAHVTELDGFRPLVGATLQLELTGPAPLRATGKQVRPGIYELSLATKAAGTYRGALAISGPAEGRIDGLTLVVHGSAEQAGPPPNEDEHAPIEFLKEQQWGVPFATAFAERGAISGSIEVAGTVDTPPGGSAEVGAQVPGRVVTPPQGLPRPGQSVRKGQLLALLSPSPSSPEDAARASLAVAEAQARKAAAQAALERSQRLIADQAISQRELEEARRELQLADEALRAARNAEGLFAGASAGKGPGTWRLLAPIAGTLVSVNATPGATVSAGEVLFRIVDVRELWLRARVPEQDAARMRMDREARYRVAGSEQWRPIPLDGGASVVSVGRTVDPVSRTVDVIYALREPDPALRVGGLVQVGIPVGEEVTSVVVPRSAIVDIDGREAVYVQLDGEHFAQHPVRTGPRSGELVAVTAGLEPGERIVTRGAHLVRLADRPSGDQAHGHIH